MGDYLDEEGADEDDGQGNGDSSRAEEVGAGSTIQAMAYEMTNANVGDHFEPDQAQPKAQTQGENQSQNTEVGHGQAEHKDVALVDDGNPETIEESGCAAEIEWTDSHNMQMVHHDGSRARSDTGPSSPLEREKCDVNEHPYGGGGFPSHDKITTISVSSEVGDDDVCSEPPFLNLAPCSPSHDNPRVGSGDKGKEA